MGGEIQMPFDKMKNQRKGFCFITFEQESVVADLLKTPKINIGAHQVDLKKATPKPDMMMMRGGMMGGRGMRGRGGPRGRGRGYGNGGYGDGYGYGGGYGGGYGQYDYSGGYGGGYAGGYGGGQGYSGGKTHRGGRGARHQPY